MGDSVDLEDGDDFGFSESGRAFTWRAVAGYAAGWMVVVAATWGYGRTSGPVHVVLVLVAALVSIYLLYLAAMYAVMFGVATSLKGWLARDRAGKAHRRLPAAGWVVVLYWLVGVIGGAAYGWFGLGLRGDEAWPPIAGLGVTGLVVTALLGWPGWKLVRRASRVARAAADGQHDRRAP